MSYNEYSLKESDISSIEESEYDYPIKGVNDDVEVVEDQTEPGNFYKGFQLDNFIAVDGGIWRKRKNYYGRIVKLSKEYVEVDCLIDPQERIFEEREFIRLLFENITDLSVGKYVIIRMFLREGKSQITVNDADNLVNKKLFEDDSQFDDLKDVENPTTLIDKL